MYEGKVIGNCSIKGSEVLFIQVDSKKQGFLCCFDLAVVWQLGTRKKSKFQEVEYHCSP